MIHGYDVSHWEPNLSVHEKMAKSGAKFCFIKANEGYQSDQMFKSHWTMAKLHGMFTGAYTFFHPAGNPTAQAEQFIKTVGHLGPGDLGPVIDWETSDGTKPFQDMNAGLKFLEVVETQLGKTPIVYGSPYFLSSLNFDERFKRYPLWIAEYQHSQPKIPMPWETWTFWQFTDQKLDLDLFNGDMAALKALAT